MASSTWTFSSVHCRDVVILEARNRGIDSYHFTTHNLGDSANYADLQKLLDAAVTAPDSAP